MGVMTRLLLLLWAGVAVSTAVDLHKRVIGGAPCPVTERLYHVKLIGSQGQNSYYCGGSLISDSWILTAAHCRRDGWTLSAVLGIHPGPGQQPVQITDGELFMSANGEHDIMLLRLPNPTQLPHVTLPDDDDCRTAHARGAMVQIAGHGASVVGHNNIRVDVPSPNLQCANMMVVDCLLYDILRILGNDQYRGYNFCGRTVGMDASPGDSGGGVVLNGMIYGVISATGDPVYADRTPVSFMNVCAYLPWIRAVIR